MSLLQVIARSLQKSHSLSPLFKSKSPLYSLTATFHRTITTQPTIEHSTLHTATQNLNDPFELIEQRINPDDHLVLGFIESLKKAVSFATEKEGLASIEELGVKGSEGLVYSVIWRLREDCKLSYLAFRWGLKESCVDDKVCELMVWILGCHGKFNTAWVVIRDMYRSSLSIRQAMLIMIDRYAAADNPSKAIWTFRNLEKFKLAPDNEAFNLLLSSLCKHGNVEEAEEFMLVNKKLFPPDVDGFNMILNGWCNMYVDVFEAKRVWREMSKYCIVPNSTSYALMISCFSKVGNLFDSLRLYDEMKKKGCIPSLEVYISLTYVLTKENCFEEAIKILDKMKENGILRDYRVYNSMICPLCEAKMVSEAKQVLTMMIEENISPTMETYHALLEAADFGETIGLLHQMRIAGLGPTASTFLLLLSKFFKLDQHEWALQVWEEMKHYDISPNATHYNVVIEGLARRGLCLEARKYYNEMKSNGFSLNPKIEKILKHDNNQRCNSVRGKMV